MFKSLKKIGKLETIRRNRLSFVFLCLISYIYLYFLSGNIVISLISLGFAIFYIDEIDGYKKLNNIKKFEKYFFDYIFCFNTYLLGGNTINFSHNRALSNLYDLYGYNEYYVILETIKIKDLYGKSISDSFMEIGNKFEMPMISNFGDILELCTNVGGNSYVAVSKLGNVIKEKLKIEEEIEVSLAKQKMELKIIKILPILMLGVLRLMNEDFIDSLIYNPMGFIIFTFSMVTIIVSVKIGNKIMEVKYN